MLRLKRWQRAMVWKLKEYVGEGERDSMKKNLAITKAVELVMDNVKERAKAKSKKEKEAEADTDTEA